MENNDTAILKLHKKIMDLKSQLEVSLNEVIDELNDLIIPNEKTFDQLIDFRQYNLDAVEENLKKIPQDTNYLYVAVARVFDFDVDLPNGIYQCETGYYQDTKSHKPKSGIILTYNKNHWKSKVFICEPINNSTFETLPNILTHDLVARVKNDTLFPEQKICFLYYKTLIYR